MNNVVCLVQNIKNRQMAKELITTFKKHEETITSLRKPHYNL
jgi:hypothetical protein